MQQDLKKTFDYKQTKYAKAALATDLLSKSLIPIINCTLFLGCLHCNTAGGFPCRSRWWCHCSLSVKGLNVQTNYSPSTEVLVFWSCIIAILLVFKQRDSLVRRCGPAILLMQRFVITPQPAPPCLLFILLKVFQFSADLTNLATREVKKIANPLLI